MSDAPPSPTRKRGAPPGNHNRLTHGIYARLPDPPPEPSGSPEKLNLDREISILRLYIQRTAQFGLAHDDLNATVTVLRAISIASVALARLVQTGGWLNQHTRARDLHDTLGETLTALEEACKGYEDPLSASLDDLGNAPPGLLGKEIYNAARNISRQLGIPLSSLLPDNPSDDTRQASTAMHPPPPSSA